MHFRFCIVTLSLLCSFVSTAYAEGQFLPLKLDRTFMNTSKGIEETPAFITAQHIEGQADNQVTATGEVELRKRGQAIFADHVVYKESDQELVADGGVRIERSGIHAQGPHLNLNIDTNIGDMLKPTFQIAINGSRGSGNVLRIEGRENYTIENVVYTTCPIGNDDWMLRARTLEIDSLTQLGTARDARVEFMGVPVLYTPWMDFALNDKRQSGFLSPTYGATGKSGNELSVPYYWNIAPNRDATITPRVMAKRGMMLGDELRYMGTNYTGEAHLDVLPNDALTNSTRSRLTLKHAQDLGGGFSASTNMNRVSDDNYYKDLATSVNSTSLTNLVREGALSYKGDWWNATTRVQNYQTLQDPLALVADPYRRLPQITLGAARPLVGGTAQFAGEFVSFSHPTTVNGQRLVLYPSMSYPLVATPSFFVTPKVGVHYTDYLLGENNSAGLPNATRTLPITSLDSGVVLERNFSLNEKAFTQTLEPRAYFVYIPYRNQSMLPNFDTAQVDFNFAQMFTENRFAGSDRIGDAKQLTLAVTSRFLDEESGAERLRVALGQRFSFATPQVNLVTPETSSTNKSDILLAVLGKITPQWSLNSAFQYNPNQAREEKLNVNARYQPESGKVLNLGYRFTRDITQPVQQVDISTQWPLSRHWGVVARVNYSLIRRQPLEVLSGFEYNESCWTMRFVTQQFTTDAKQVTTGFFVQLELHGMVKMGSDPFTALRQSISGFTKSIPSSGASLGQGLR